MDNAGVHLRVTIFRRVRTPKVLRSHGKRIVLDYLTLIVSAVFLFAPGV